MSLDLPRCSYQKAFSLLLERGKGKGTLFIYRLPSLPKVPTQPTRLCSNTSSQEAGRRTQAQRHIHTKDRRSGNRGLNPMASIYSKKERQGPGVQCSNKRGSGAAAPLNLEEEIPKANRRSKGSGHEADHRTRDGARLAA